MKNTRFLLSAFMLFFLFVLLLVSCAEEQLPGNDVTLQLFDLNTFNAQRQLWLDQDLQNYSFHLSYEEYVGGPLNWSGTVVIKNGVVDSIVPDRPHNPAYDFPRDVWRTFTVPVSGIYDAIIAQREWVVENANNTEWKNPSVTRHYSLEVEYNDEYHFPRYYSYASTAISTDENKYLLGGYSNRTITITDFSENILPADNVTLQLFDLETFNAQRQLWLDQNLRNYSFHLSSEGYSHHDLLEWSGTVVIKDGVVDTVIPDDPANLTGYNGYPNVYYGYQTITIAWHRQNFVAPFSGIPNFHDDTRWGIGIYNTLSATREGVEVEANSNRWRERSTDFYTLMEIEYDDEYHFPKYYRCFSSTKPENSAEYSFSITKTISNFTIDP